MLAAMLPLTISIAAPAPVREKISPRVDTETHAQQLRDFGFTVIPDPVLEPSSMPRLSRTCLNELDVLLQHVDHLGIDSARQFYSFNEICHRSPNRWDLQLPDGHSLKRVLEERMPSVAPIIETLHRLPLHRGEGRAGRVGRLLGPRGPTVIQTGAIVSKPGSTAQNFHADAAKSHLALASLLPRHRLYNMFIPLVDIELNGDGTEFLPGSHLNSFRGAPYREAMARSGKLEDDSIMMASAVAPACPAGGVVLFDYRLLHRGLANLNSRDRPVLYAVLSTGWAWDKVNFPEASLLRAVESFPKDAEMVETMRKRINQCYPYWHDMPEFANVLPPSQLSPR